jgi:predicted RecB family nuclease
MPIETSVKIKPKVCVPPLGGYIAKTCARRAHNDFDPLFKGLETDPPSPALEERFEKGREFEEALGVKWSQKLGKRFYAIPDNIIDSDGQRSFTQKQLREKLTMKILQNPGQVEVVWNPRLPADLENSRIAEPDFLLKGKQKQSGGFYWIPGDVKWHATLQGKGHPKSYSLSSLAQPLVRNNGLLGEGNPHLSDLMQLAHYRRVLEAYGFADPADTSFEGVIIGKEEVPLWVNLDTMKYFYTPNGQLRQSKHSVQDIYDAEFQFRVKVIERALERKTDRSLAPLVEPEWKVECKECPYRTVCHDELKIILGHHITLLPHMTPQFAQAYYAAGISTAVKLAQYSVQTAELIASGIDTWNLLCAARNSDGNALIQECFELSSVQLDTLADMGILTASDAVAILHEKTAELSQFNLHRLDLFIDQARVSLVDRVHRSRGVSRVSIPRAVIEEDVDIEDSDGLVYLIGVLKTGRGIKASGETKQRQIYTPFVNWSNTPEGEAKVFAAWWAHVKEIRSFAASKKYSYCAYHYHHHETTMFRKLAYRHYGKPGVPSLEELNQFLESSSWVDMYPIISEKLIWPIEDMTLKSVAKYIKFFWRDETPGGGNSLAWYSQAINGSTDYQKKLARKRLLQYNEDDVLATLAIRDWITKLEKTQNPDSKLPPAEALDTRWCRNF